MAPPYCTESSSPNIQRAIVVGVLLPGRWISTVGQGYENVGHESTSVDMRARIAAFGEPMSPRAPPLAMSTGVGTKNKPRVEPPPPCQLRVGSSGSIVGFRPIRMCACIR